MEGTVSITKKPAENEDKKLVGVVSTGLGEGTAFLSMPEYKKPLSVLLGFKPFPGTLNLTITDPSELTDFVAGLPEERVSSFKHDGQAFGGLSLYEITIKKKNARTKSADGALVVPDKSHRTGVVELVAGVSLRETLGLADGDEVAIAPRQPSNAQAEREPLREVEEQAPLAPGEPAA